MTQSMKAAGSERTGLTPVLAPACASSRPPAASADKDVSVTDNFPDTLPIGRAELEVIETYFGSFLDELLSG